MSFMDAPSAPAPGTALGLGNKMAGQQQGYNISAQAGSMPNTFNPYGSVNYQKIGTGPGGVPIYGSNVSLSPEQQGLFNQYQTTKGLAGEGGSNLIGGANYGAQSPADAIGGMTGGITSDILGKEVGYLQPFQQTERTQLDTQLKNQGLQPGTPGYDNAMRQMDTSHGLTVSNFLAQAEPQAFEQAFKAYNEPAQLGASLSQFGAPSMPTSLPTAPLPGLQPANLTSATGVMEQAQQAQYAAQMQQYQSMMSGMFGIPSALIGGYASSPTGGAAITSLLAGLSDRRLKWGITRISTLQNGLPVYSFRYLGNDKLFIGMMADEVEKVRPEAVIEIGGYKAVNYALALS